MCGIFFYLGDKPIRGRDMKRLEKYANKIKHRGPDETRIRYSGGVYRNQTLVSSYKLSKNLFFHTPNHP